MSRARRYATRRAAALAAQASDSDDDDDGDQLGLVSRQAVQMTPEDDTALSFGAAGRASTRSARPPTRFTNSRDDSDDGDSDSDLFGSAAQPPVAKRRQVTSEQSSASQRASATDGAASAAAHDPFSVAARAQPETLQSRVSAQRTRRSQASSVIDALRRGAIPGYDDAERDLGVEIDREAFRNFNNDSAYEVQDAFKPPWAPSVPRAMLEKLRTWETMETLSELELRRQPWYSMIMLVAGFLSLPLDALVFVGPRTASADAVQPTRSRVASNGGQFNTIGNAGGAGFADERGLTGGGTIANLRGPTPFRDAAFAGAVDPQAREAREVDFRFRLNRERQAADGVPREGDGAGDGVVDDEDAAQSAPNQQRPTPRPGNADNAPRREAVVDEEADANFLDLAFGAFGQIPRSGARFQALREKRRDPQWYERDVSDEARTINSIVRAQGAQARAWVGRPIASGVYYINPNYTSSRDFAHTAITSAAEQLSTVPLRAFLELPRSQSDVVRVRVRTQFAKAIAASYNMVRHNSNRSAKLAADAANLQCEFEAIKRWFVERIEYDATRDTFSDRGPRAGLRRAWQQPDLPTSYAPPGERELIARFGRWRGNLLPPPYYAFTPGTRLTRFND